MYYICSIYEYIYIHIIYKYKYVINSWRARKQILSIIFIKYFLSARRLLFR